MCIEVRCERFKVFQNLNYNKQYLLDILALIASIFELQNIMTLIGLSRNVHTAFPRFTQSYLCE